MVLRRSAPAVQVLEAKDNSLTDAFCSYTGVDNATHVTAIVIGSIAAVIAVVFILAICCGAFVPCCAACAGLALLVITCRCLFLPGPACRLCFRAELHIASNVAVRCFATTFNSARRTFLLRECVRAGHRGRIGGRTPTCSPWAPWHRRSSSRVTLREATPLEGRHRPAVTSRSTRTSSSTLSRTLRPALRRPPRQRPRRTAGSNTTRAQRRSMQTADTRLRTQDRRTSVSPRTGRRPEPRGTDRYFLWR